MIDGQGYFVSLTQERLKLALNLIGGLSDNGKLNLVKAPDDLKFTTLSEALDDS